MIKATNVAVYFDGRKIGGAMTKVHCIGPHDPAEADRVALGIEPFAGTVKITHVDGYPVADKDEAAVALDDTMRRLRGG